MKKIDYKKLLKRLIDEYPHELDKIEKIVDDADKNGQVARIEFDAIIKSYIWSSDEKARLLRLFGYNKREHEIRYTDRGNCEFKTRDYLYTIEHDILSGFGMGCLGCPSATMETLEQACYIHGLDLNEVMNKLNEK